MKIESKPVQSNAQVKGFLAETLPAVTLETAAVTEGLDNLNASVQGAMGAALEDAVEKLQGAVEAGALPEQVVTDILAGFSHAVSTFDLMAVSNYTGAKRAAIETALKDAGEEITNPWAHFVKGKKAPSVKPDTLSFEL